MFSIRKLEAADADRLARAFTAIGWDKPAAIFRRYFEDQKEGSRDVLVAEVDGEMAGYVTLNWQPAYPLSQYEEIPEIQDLNVLPGHRRRGIGSALLDAAEALAREKVEAVGIRVGLTADYGHAQRLYVRHGYMPDGRGIAKHDRTVAFGDEVRIDDDLVLCMTKRLA